MEVSVLGVLLCVCMLDIVAGVCPGGTYGYDCGNQCHCPLDKCDATIGCRPEDCDPGWSGLTCHKGNIALHKHASASSVYGNMGAGKAVNGDNSAEDFLSCFHSDWGNSMKAAWWRVDLGEEIRFHHVTIYFRRDYSVHRNGIQIYIADTEASPTDGVNCYNVTGNGDGTDIPDVLTATCSGEGRYLVLYTITVNNDPAHIVVPIMDFCEVEVDVCSNGTFGADCDNYCHCDSEVCDYVSGVCPGGVCLPGWATETCDTVCEFGRYGANCRNICPNRNCKGDNSSCDHVTGECFCGCKAGWIGTDCTEICSFGTFGVNCTGVCGQCIDLSACHHDNGTCLTGCSDGWTNHACTEICEFDRYGANCSQICPNRNCKGDNSSCDHVTGKCVGGCTAGWDGTDCTHGVRLPFPLFARGATDGAGLYVLVTETKNNNTPLIHSISLVIGLVVGVVLTLLLGGAVHLYLLRKGSLAWTRGNVKDGDRRDTVDPNMALGDNYTSISELPRTDGRNTQDNDYAGLDTDTRTDDKHYDFIQNKVYVNTYNKQPQNVPRGKKVPDSCCIPDGDIAVCTGQTYFAGRPNYRNQRSFNIVNGAGSAIVLLILVIGVIISRLDARVGGASPDQSEEQFELAGSSQTQSMEADI
ncbi:multiple epidermal growth factor-like domains protein 10 [Haliotis rufescens]|uniref:multiple epidermal growth factor-like domains protein 10 n=1 Tax=Haliotis rufescens TaxID=6454 RepID=UPI00201FAF2C|nr:multiple epidermal growth factor-like domains protein 10 [Haliotis rufescens]